MQIKKHCLCYGLILIFIFSSVFNINVTSKEEAIPNWNNNWSYRQEIFLPFSSFSDNLIFQPIDINVIFENKCWGLNEKEHSIRVLCLKEDVWQELESQIYNIDFSDSGFIKSCGLIFLIPEFSEGNERYFIYYDNSKKPSIDYIDHLDIEDSYYYYEPISGVSVEGDYYKITQDGYVVYGIGQKGKVINRRLSQAIVNEKPDNKEFDAIDSYNIASFCISYNKGPEDEDELSSDQKLVSKEIIIDGNLMIEFGIISESEKGELRTTNIYKYYYYPSENKRIYVHVKHESLKEGLVSGIENLDGRYGVLLTYKSRSERLNRMRFGEILPYLHVFNENNEITEYKINQNPEGKNPEWIVPYQDDIDLAKNGWISYDEGEEGKSHSIIFHSNNNIVKQGKNEREGIQIKVAEREYLDVIGAELDICTINFGRNSYEVGGGHDKNIPSDLIVEFDAEVYTSIDGGYKQVSKEAEVYHKLINLRKNVEDDIFEGDKYIHTLTVIPRLSARILSHPFLRNVTGITLSEIWGELYKENELIQISYTNKPLLGPPIIKFPKIEKGDYIVKIYRKILNFNKTYIGFASVSVKEDEEINIFCTIQKNIEIKCKDQYGNGISNVNLKLLLNESIVATNTTKEAGTVKLSVPIDIWDNHKLKATYKGFVIYYEDVKKLQNKINFQQNLYDISIDVKDKLGMLPGVDIKPKITSESMVNQIFIEPEIENSGKYIFRDLPEDNYQFQMSFGSYKKVEDIKILNSDVQKKLVFSARYRLNTKLYDSRGNRISDADKIEIIRRGKEVYESKNVEEKLFLPPGNYKIKIYSDNKLIGIKNIELVNDKEVHLVTSIKPLIPLLVTVLLIVFILEMFVLLIIKKISLNSFLKLLAMSIIIISLFQPWWILNAEGNTANLDKKSEMFVIPQTMVETLSYENYTYYDLATIPEIFTDFLNVLIIIVLSGFILMGISFIPNIILKRRFYKILIFASILFLILVAIAFSYGMSRLCEISVGSLQGQGELNVLLPDGKTSVMSAEWGLGLGFYLCIFAAIITVIAGIVDSLNKRKLLKSIFKKS